MRCFIYITILSLGSFFLSAVCFAHEKVVVIPLNSTSVVGVISDPFQYSDTKSTAISTNTTLVTGVHTGLVPAGKRLFVHNLSYRISGDNIYRNPLCHAYVYTGSSYTIEYPLLMTKTQSDVKEVFTSTPVIMMYADPGDYVGVRCTLGTGDSTYERFAVSGYYIDL